MLNEKEIYIFLTKGYGTGVRETEAHVLRGNLSEMVSPSPIDDISGVISSNVNIVGDERKYTVNINGESHIFTHKESEAGMWFDEVVVGKVTSYRVENSQLIASMSLQASPGTFLGGVDVQYALKEGAFELRDIQFVEVE